MCKTIILGDMHIGARNASPILCEFQIKFFEEVLFPYMEQEGIKRILQLGDMFDTRKFSNHIILDQWKRRVFDVIESNNFEIITLIGNHDSASKNTLEVNSQKLLLAEYVCVRPIEKPTVQNLGQDFLLIPWICEDNEEEVANAVFKSDELFCVGHFEFAGFDMHKGMPANGGYDANEFEKFDLVLSGHYHTRSGKDNVLYTGVPYEMTWADYNDQKGFHVFDSKNQKVEFIENPFTLFHRFEYDDSNGAVAIPQGLKDTYVKVVVAKKTDPYEFDKFILNISSQNPADLKITDIENDFEDIEVDDVLEIEDTKSLIDSFVDQIETDLDKDTIKAKMNVLYLSALEVVE